MNTLLFGLALAVAAPALKDPAGPSIIGNWKLTEWLYAGGGMSSIAEGSGVEFLPGGKRIWRDGNEDSEERSYQLHPKTPTAIDLIRMPAPQATPVIHPAIFKIEGNKLVIVIGQPNGVRPTKFDDADAYMTMKFERIVKKD